MDGVNGFGFTEKSGIMRLLKREEFNGYEFVAIESIEGGEIKYSYNLNKDGKNLAYVSGMVDKARSLFTVEYLYSAPNSSKKATILAFNELIPRVEKDLAERKISAYKTVTNERMARYMQKNHGGEIEQYKGRFHISKSLRRMA